MNIGFACTADVGEGDVAIVVGCVTAKQVRQVGLGCVQLLFSRSLTFGSEIRTAQGFVAQTADSTVYAVDADGFATVLSDFDGIGKFQLYATFNGFADNVAVAFNVDSVAQCVFVAAARTADIDAFGDIFGIGVGFLINFIQLCSVNSIGAVSSKCAFGNFGNLVAAVVQTVFGQADGFFAAAWHRGQGDAVCCGFGNIAVFVSQGNIAAVDGGHVTVGFKLGAVQTLQLFGKFDVERTVKVV